MSGTLPEIQSIKAEVAALLDKQHTAESVEGIKREWLSKDGRVRQLFKLLQGLSAEEKPEAARELNDIKTSLELFIERFQSSEAAARQAESLKKEFFDLSLPAKTPGLGKAHPVTRVERVITSVIRQYGFQNVVGPEVENEYYCFDALNFPPEHPARDIMDTFYTDTNHLLRTHTTCVSARVIQKQKPPIKVASFGRVYRNETEDASHQAMFHQFDLVWIDEGLTLAHLMGLIHHILKEIYGKRRKVRFVPKFYPYTEPSFGPQIDCVICGGSGCSSCGDAGWVTVAGAGLLHRNVLTELGHDPDKVAGLAFGLGSSRLAAQMFNFESLRMLYENDLRVLKGL